MELLTVNDVAWDRQRPCNDCPFLKTSPFHEGIAGSLPAYMESIKGGTFSHTCHKSDPRPECDGPHTWQGQPWHCVGAVQMLLKTGGGLDVQLPLLQAAERGELDLAAAAIAAKADDRVFTVTGLLRFYERELGRRAATPKAKAAARRSRRKGR
ncbi:MAG: hypothetical protein V4597_11460 [Pseudomonadota bacterium]